MVFEHFCLLLDSHSRYRQEEGEYDATTVFYEPNHPAIYSAR